VSTEQLQSRVQVQFSLVQASMKTEVITEVNELVKKWMIAAEEYKRSAGQELTQCDYCKIEIVIRNCKFRLVYTQ
jgi:hypothetical protein